LGADHGLFKVRLQELDQVAEGQALQAHSIHYGRSAGLPSLQANFGATPGSWRGGDGRLWMPMGTALAAVDPDQLREEAEPPPVLLKRVTVDDQIVAAYGGVLPVVAGIDLATPGRTLRLPPDHHRVQFEFTALSFGSPENVRFQYQLEGFDEHWREGEAPRVASYSRLPAGRFRFRVKACNSSGVWNENGAVLSFVGCS